MRFVWVGPLAAALLLGSCASVTRGTTEMVNIISNPPSADVRTTSGLACLTPCSLPIGRKDEFVATFSKEGYESVSVPVVTRVGGTGAAGFVGNALLGGVIGMGVDVVTGAALDHCPNPLSVVLRPIRRAGQTPPRGAVRASPGGVPVMEDYVQPDPAGHCKVEIDPNATRNDVR